jgi:hypothetical protein
MNPAWVGRFGQIWLKPDIEYKYLFSHLLYIFGWFFFPFFSHLSHLAIKNLQNHFISKNLISIIPIFSSGFGRNVGQFKKQGCLLGAGVGLQRKLQLQLPSLLVAAGGARQKYSAVRA